MLRLLHKCDLKLLIQHCRFFHLVTPIEMYCCQLMRTALTLAAVEQGEVRLLCVHHQQQVYSSIGLQLCLVCAS